MYNHTLGNMLVMQFESLAFLHCPRHTSLAAMSLACFEQHLNGQQVHVVYHGGCPDGCMSAIIMKHAIFENYKPSCLQMWPTTHAKRNADKLTEGCTAIFVDVSPTADDETQLRACRCVIVLDHHDSVIATVQQLQQSLPLLENFSDVSGTECGVTLVNRFCASQFVPDRLIHLFHNHDVFTHELPEEFKKYKNAFKGFITQGGVDKCTIELVEKMLADTDAAFHVGEELYAPVKMYTKKVFEKKKCLQDLPEVSVWAVDLAAEEIEAMDFEFYQHLINELADSKAVVFATMMRIPDDKGTWSTSLRRAGQHLDVGAVCELLAKCEDLGFVTGGGLPWAAGAQNKDFNLSADLICQEIADICKQMLCLIKARGGQYPSAINDSNAHPT